MTYVCNYAVWLVAVDPSSLLALLLPSSLSLSVHTLISIVLIVGGVWVWMPYVMYFYARNNRGVWTAELLAHIRTSIQCAVGKREKNRYIQEESSCLGVDCYKVNKGHDLSDYKYMALLFNQKHFEAYAIWRRVDGGKEGWYKSCCASWMSLSTVDGGKPLQRNKGRKAGSKSS